MHKDAAVVVLESLASGVRLDVYRLLVRKGPEGLVASEIAAALDLPPTNLSFHFKALVQAGLLTVKQEGRFQRYRPNLSLMRDLVAYLTAAFRRSRSDGRSVSARARKASTRARKIR